jgi:hypothetical protein
MRITFALLLVAAGCSTRRTISRTPFESEVARINADASDREVKIIDTAGREVAATRLSLDLENATWHDAAGQPKMVPIEALRQISHLSPGHPRAMGALQGLGLGLLVGAATLCNVLFTRELSRRMQGRA